MGWNFPAPFRCDPTNGLTRSLLEACAALGFSAALGFRATLGFCAVLGMGSISHAQATEEPPVRTVPAERAPPQSSPESSPRRVVVLVLPVDPTHASTADALTELLIGAIAADGDAAAILGKEELQAQLHQSDEDSLSCLGSPPCLGRLGVQLGVSEVLAATLAKREQRWVFDLQRIDTHTGVSMGQAFRELASDDVGLLADSLVEALGEIQMPTQRLSRLRVSVDATEGVEVRVDGVALPVEDGEARVPGLDWGVHHVQVTADGYERWQRDVELTGEEEVRLVATLVPRAPTTDRVPPPPVAPEPRTQVQPLSSEPSLSPVVWVGAGATVAAGALAIGFGLRSQQAADGGLNRAEALAFVHARRRDARIGNTAIGLAVGSLGLTAVGIWLSDPFGRRARRSPATVQVGRTGVRVDWQSQW